MLAKRDDSCHRHVGNATFLFFVCAEEIMIEPYVHTTFPKVPSNVSFGRSFLRSPILIAWRIEYDPNRPSFDNRWYRVRVFGRSIVPSWHCYLHKITLMRGSCVFERAICFVYIWICWIMSRAENYIFIFVASMGVVLVCLFTASYRRYIISDYCYYTYFIDKALSIRSIVFV